MRTAFSKSYLFKQSKLLKLNEKKWHMGALW